jgi:hypothetical protein
LLDLIRRQDRADAGQHFGEFIAYHPQCVQCHGRSQREFHRIDASRQQRTSDRRGIAEMVNDEHGNHATTLDPPENIVIKLRVHYFWYSHYFDF